MSQLMLKLLKRVALRPLSLRLGVLNPKREQHHEDTYYIATGLGYRLG